MLKNFGNFNKINTGTRGYPNLDRYPNLDTGGIAKKKMLLLA